MFDFQNKPWHSYVMSPAKAALKKLAQFVAAFHTAAVTPAPFPNLKSLVTKTAPAGSSNLSALGLVKGDWLDVPAGSTLVYDATTDLGLGGIIYEGTLDIGSATGDKVGSGTIFGNGGSLIGGSCKTNTPINGTFTWTFPDVTLDPTFDPAQFGNGWLTMAGSVDICGSANKTAWAWANPIPKGSTTITLAVTPADWNPNEKVMIPNTSPPFVGANGALNPAPLQDEVIPLGSVSGNVVTLSQPTTWDHLPPIVDFSPETWSDATHTYSFTATLTASGTTVSVAFSLTITPTAGGTPDTISDTLIYNNCVIVNNGTGVQPMVPVANLSRRITFQSANPNGTRGHIMFMRGMGGAPTITNACHVLAKDVGRTVATQPVTDPMVDANGVLVPGTADNPRARYSWHSHRQGQRGPDGTTASALQTWDGIVAWGFLKLGINNHDSNVVCTRGVAFNGQGTCFFTERGTEIGVYDGGLGCRTSGNGSNGLVGIDNRISDDDFGHTGSGGWGQGPGVFWSNNVFCNHYQAGFIYDPGENPVLGVIVNEFDVTLLPSTYKTEPATTSNGMALIRHMGLVGFESNTTFCNPSGVFLWLSDRASTGDPPMDLTSWNDYKGFDQNHATNALIGNLALIGPNWAPNSVGVYFNTAYGKNYQIVGPSVAVTGYEIGAYLTEIANYWAVTKIAGGYWNNVWNHFLNADTITGSQNIFTAQQAYGLVPAAALKGRIPGNIYFYGDVGAPANELPALTTTDWFEVAGSPYDAGGPNVQLFDGRQVFSKICATDYVPMPSSTFKGIAPDEVLDLTNAQLAAKFGNPVGGVLATVDHTATDTSITNGLVGPPAKYPFPWVQGIPKLTTPPNTFGVSYTLASTPDWRNGSAPTQGFTVQLQPGGQLITNTMSAASGGQIVSGWVIGPAAPPPLPPPLPVPPPPGSGSAVFVKKDVTTQGTWQGVYGKDGYNVINNAVKYPSYVTVTPAGNSAFTWVASTTDVRALQDAVGTGRIAATWYNTTNFSVDVKVTDGNAHQLALYFIDWEVAGRSEEIQVLDTATGDLLDVQTIAGFGTGVWLLWNITNDVTLKMFNLNTTSNAVLSGLFFDPPGGSPPPPPPPPSPPPPATITQTLSAVILRPVTLNDTIVMSNGSAPSGTVTFTVMAGTTEIASASSSVGANGLASVEVTLPVNQPGTSYTWIATFMAVNSAPASLTVD